VYIVLGFGVMWEGPGAVGRAGLGRPESSEDSARIPATFVAKSNMMCSDVGIACGYPFIFIKFEVL